MRDSRLDGLFAGLDVAFDASVAREEDEAASDLAFSLRQGRSLADVLAHWGPFDILLEDGTAVGAAVLGTDFALGGDPPVVVPLERAAFARRESGGRGVEPVIGTMLELLRCRARAGAEVVVVSPRGNYHGRLAYVGNDHVAISGPGGEKLVGLGVVNFVRFVGEGSVDES